jgi:hypothetical protein
MTAIYYNKQGEQIQKDNHKNLGHQISFSTNNNELVLLGSTKFASKIFFGFGGKKLSFWAI